MECVFCYQCGSLADESKKCQSTSCSQYGQIVEPKYLNQRLNEGQLKDKKWVGDYVSYCNKDIVTHWYTCDRCSYIMWHHLQYCPKCGGKFSLQEATRKELVEKYGTYRTGY